MSSYYKTFNLMERVRTPTGFPFPNDWFYSWGPGMEVSGIFIQSQSDTMMAAGTETVSTSGRFAHHPSIPLHPFDVLRREEDGIFIRLIADPQKSPEKAESQVKSWLAEIIDRNDVQ